MDQRRAPARRLINMQSIIDHADAIKAAAVNVGKEIAEDVRVKLMTELAEPRMFEDYYKVDDIWYGDVVERKELTDIKGNDDAQDDGATTMSVNGSDMRFRKDRMWSTTACYVQTNPARADRCVFELAARVDGTTMVVENIGGGTEPVVRIPMHKQKGRKVEDVCRMRLDDEHDGFDAYVEANAAKIYDSADGKWLKCDDEHPRGITQLEDSWIKARKYTTTGDILLQRWYDASAMDRYPYISHRCVILTTYGRRIILKYKCGTTPAVIVTGAGLYRLPSDWLLVMANIEKWSDGELDGLPAIMMNIFGASSFSPTRIKR